ncbi:hypothetical protein B484DRAFT_441846 [Ochromonadaceae sp. CCMP2298]|nr:hypothetical protein B484DRAFT_441846 [Ochromonadaceae sp. CCMP2298]
MEMSLEGREQMGEQMGKEEGEEGEEGEGGDSGDSAPFSGGSVRETEESDSRHNHHNNSNNNTTISSSATSSSSSFRGPRSLPWQQPPGSPIRIHADLGSSVTHLDASRLLSRIGVRHSNEALLDNGYAVDIFLPPVGGGDVGGGGDGASDGQGTGAGARRHKGIAVEFDGPSHFESYLQQPLGPTAMKRRHILGSGYLLAAIPYWKYRIDMPEEMRVRILQRYIAEAEGEGER